MSKRIDDIVDTYKRLLDTVPEMIFLLQENAPFDLLPSQKSEHNTLREGLSDIERFAGQELLEDDYQLLLKRLNSILSERKIEAKKTVEREDGVREAVGYLPPGDAISKIENVLLKIDLNSIRRSGYVFNANFERLHFGNAIMRRELEIAVFNLFKDLNDSGLTQILSTYENAIRQSLFLERLPEIEGLLLPKAELETLLEEVRSKESKGEELTTFPPSESDVEELPKRNWLKVARGGGLACGNVLFGVLALIGSSPVVKGEVLAPALWAALTSTYTGVFDVIEGWSKPSGK
jgi:hypothetical protein